MLMYCILYYMLYCRLNNCSIRLCKQQSPSYILCYHILYVKYYLSCITCFLKCRIADYLNNDRSVMTPNLVPVLGHQRDDDWWSGLVWNGELGRPEIASCSNGSSATASCRVSILVLGSRYPDQQLGSCMEWRARQARNMATASSKASMDLLQLQVAEFPFCYLAAGIQSSNDGHDWAGWKYTICLLLLFRSTIIITIITICLLLFLLSTSSESLLLNLI